jgi:hypothetical protein
LAAWNCPASKSASRSGTSRPDERQPRPSPGRQDRCLHYSTIRANPWSGPVPNPARQLRLQPPARPRKETIENRAGRLPLDSTFSCYGK